MKIQKILKGFHQLPTTIKHCGILTLVFGSVLLAIFFTHPNAVYGAQTDWSNQHFAIPEYSGQDLCNWKLVPKSGSPSWRRSKYL